MTKFNLSNKITTPEDMAYCGKAHIHIEDVKEFIKLIQDLILSARTNYKYLSEEDKFKRCHYVHVIKVERKMGNNPEPLEHAPKRCCDFCNITKVIPKRLENAGFIKKKIVFS